MLFPKPGDKLTPLLSPAVTGIFASKSIPLLLHHGLLLSQFF